MGLHRGLRLAVFLPQLRGLRPWWRLAVLIPKIFILQGIALFAPVPLVAVAARGAHAATQSPRNVVNCCQIC